MLGLKLFHVSKRGHSCYVRVLSLWSTATQSYWRNSMDGLIFNSLRPSPNRRHFADDIFKCFFENENEWISPRISLKWVARHQWNCFTILKDIICLILFIKDSVELFACELSFQYAWDSKCLRGYILPKLLIHSQTSTAAPFTFWKGLVIEYHILLCIW